MRAPLTVLCVVLLFSASAVSEFISVAPSNCTSGGTDLDSALASLKNNDTLSLESGTHCINTFDSVVSSLRNVTIEGEENVTIQCVAGRGLALFNMSALTIRTVTFDGCGANNGAINRFIATLNLTIDFFFQISSESQNFVSLMCGYCVDFSMTEVTVTNTLGLGFLGVNLVGESVLHDVTFSRNVPIGCYSLNYSLDNERIGGGALVVYSDFLNEKLDDRVELEISNASFLYNSYCAALAILEFYTDFVNSQDLVFILSGGGGLGVRLAQLNYDVDVKISDSLFQNNTARGGGGVSLQVYTGVYNSNITITDCSFTKNGLEGGIVEEYNYTTSSIGLSVITDTYHPRIDEVACRIVSSNVPTGVIVSNTNFVDNRAFSAAGASVISLYSPGQRRQTPHYVIFDSCTFSGNYAFSASAIFIQEWKYIAAQPGLNVILRDVQIFNNTNFRLTQVSSESLASGAIHVVATNVTILGRTAFKNNVGPGVYLDRGIMHIDGDVTFFNNSASLGGGMRLESQSLLIVSNNSAVSFISNRANVYGGGIFSNINPESGQLNVPSCPLYFGELNLLCFQDLSEHCPDVTKFNVTLSFSGNQALYGSMIYGTTLDACPWTNRVKESENDTDGLILELLYERQEQNRSTPIRFDKPPNTTLQVATQPILLEISNVSNETIKAIPGRPFTLHTIAYDQFLRPSVSIVTSLVERDGVVDYTNHSSIGDSNYWLLSGDNDSSPLFHLPVSVFGVPNSGAFNLTIVTVGSYAQMSVLVELVDCAPGFVYNNMSRACECDKALSNVKPNPVLCNGDGTLSVPAGTWIGYTNYDNYTVLAATACHYDYCVIHEKNVTSQIFSERQCNVGYNRTGIGCAGCKEGYGLAFGTNRCRQCSNSSLVFILGLIGLGIALITTLSVFHVSISNGYINGILFYANIVALFNPVFSSQSPVISNLLLLFSWLNLDLGFEVCFYENMTALQRSTLAFIFPLFLYALIGIIVGISKVSSRFAGYFNRGGYSATKLFATLFVMTYTNLMRTCIEVLGYSQVRFLDKREISVWIVDANQPYFQGWHIPLCLVAIAWLLLYLIPAPLLLMFPGLVLRVPILRKYKPFYDPFWVPFKPSFQFWTGLRLLLRFLPFIFANFITTPLNVFLLVIFLLILIYAQAILHPFQGKYQTASDLFLLINLTALIVGYLYFYTFTFNSREIRDDILSNQESFETAYFSVIISLVYCLLLVFIIVRIFVRYPILQYYVWKLLTKLCCCKFCKKWIPEKPRVGTKKSYGTTIQDEPSSSTTADIENTLNSTDPSTNGTNKGVATYSELREPLLESGSVEIVHRRTN